MNDKPSTTIVPTIGIPHYFSTYKLSDGSLVNVKIVDTAGQEKFKSISGNYYKHADCCLLVYDISKRQSFEECKDYYNTNIKDKCQKDIQVIVLGNKTDLEDLRQVSSEEGAKFSEENNYLFMETSCLKNTNVADAFDTLIEITNIEAKKNGKKLTKDGIMLKNEKNEKKKCFCPLFK